MKTNVLVDRETFPGALLYTWEEHCDLCGKLIHSYGYKSTTYRLDEFDYCYSCLTEKFCRTVSSAIH